MQMHTEAKRIHSQKEGRTGLEGRLWRGVIGNNIKGVS